MAEASAEALTRALSLLNIRRENSAVVLKPEQETAINNLLNGRDVMAILPTGFGKSMIYTVFALAKEEISSSKTCVIVIAPLKSIIDDQISEMLSLNCTAMELTTEALNLVRESPPQFLYCSAETVIDTRQPGNVFKKLDTRQSEILTDFFEMARLIPLRT